MADKGPSFGSTYNSFLAGYYRGERDGEELEAFRHRHNLHADWVKYHQGIRNGAKTTDADRQRLAEMYANFVPRGK